VRRRFDEAMPPLKTGTSSCGAVVFQTADSGETLVLMVENRNGWAFPKGLMEPGETERETAVREIFEETGILARLFGGFRMSVGSAKAGEKRSVVFFLGEYESGDVTPQLSEVSDAAWVPAEKAEGLIAFSQDRAVFQSALARYLRGKASGMSTN
jgi:bis(5'-nucleosidyl)-tetraphosphatase